MPESVEPWPFKPVDPHRWYKVWEVAEMTLWSVDTVRRWIYRGKLKAFVMPGQSSRRKRIYRSTRILGADLIQFIRDNLWRT